IPTSVSPNNGIGLEVPSPQTCRARRASWSPSRFGSVMTTPTASAARLRARCKATSRCRRPLASHVRTLHMSWSREGGRSGPRGYPHGNLKEALIRAALELIAQKGPAGFTFAEAARWAGVSPAAPYRHFRDRDELLIDVARRGFDRFAVTLESAWDG